MNRKRVGTASLAFLMATVALFLLQNCEVDPPYTDGNNPNPTDTNYIATPYELEIPFRFPQMNIPADNPLSVEGIKLGRLLFYEPMLSFDGSTSCGSCHRQSTAFVDSTNIFSEQAGGSLTKRNTPPIINIGWMDELFWDGRAETVEDVVADAIVDEQKIDWETSLAYLREQPEYDKLFKKAFGKDDYGQE